MPELPEIEHLRRTLEPVLRGRRVRDVRLFRRDVAHADQRVNRRDLLAGDVIGEIGRHGKQLAIAGIRGPAVCVHLGMSGQLRHVAPAARVPESTHVHCVWWLVHRDGRPAGRLVFRDPRRFGGLWPFPSLPALRAARWDRLGPDALTVEPGELAVRLGRTKRAVKSALLDQTLLAGIGNIYADEALFAAGIHPASAASRLPERAIGTLAEAIRAILSGAIEAGGSTLRDYVDAQGHVGRFAAAHRVYGRGGQPCDRCRAQLEQALLGQRSTVWCPGCQQRYP